MNDRPSPDRPAGPQDAEKPADAAAPVAVDPLDAAAQEAADLKDKLLRALAEMENLRRRTEREVADARLYGIASFARDILGVADNMDRALQALDTDLREKADATTKALLDGVELTERELLKVLEKHGIKKIEPHRREIRSEFPSGHVRGSGRVGPGRHHRSGGAGGLSDCGSDAAPGSGRGRKGRVEIGA